MTRTVAGVIKSGKLELLEEPKGLREGRVRVTIEEEPLRRSAEPVDRRAFLRLPLAERRRILKEQAESLAGHYEGETEWREWLAGDIVEY
jgi:hypothetical protein